MDLSALESILSNRLNVDSPSWHVELIAEPIVHAAMEFSIPVADVATAAQRIKLAGQLTRTCCRHGMRRPIGITVTPDEADGRVSVRVMELEYRKRGPATAIADLMREFKEGRGGVSRS